MKYTAPRVPKDLGLDLDDEEKSFTQGFDRSPLVKPVSNLPDIDGDLSQADPERKLHHRREIEESVAPPSPASSAGSSHPPKRDPSRTAPPSIKPASIRPASTRPPSEHPASTRPPPLSVRPASIRPLAEADAPRSQRPPPIEDLGEVIAGPGARSPIAAPVSLRLVALLTALFLGSVCVIYLVTRPGCIASSKRQIEAGNHTSKHLKLAWHLAEPWYQAEDRDAVEMTSDGWRRTASVFFQGESVTQFKSQMVVIVFDKEGTRASDEDARQLGANESVDAASRRRCETIQIKGTLPANRCFMLQPRAGQSLGLMEVSFSLDGRAIFVRFMHELPPIPAATDPIEAATLNSQFELRMLQQVERGMLLVDSFRTVP